MSWKEILVYVILFLVGIISIYGLSDSRKSIKNNSNRTKIRNLIFYMGILLGVFGLFELIKIVVQSFLKAYF